MLKLTSNATQIQTAAKCVMSSLFFHNHAAVASSRAALEGFTCLQSLKYFPVTFSSSGSTANRICVWAPDSIVLKTSHFAGLKKILLRKRNAKLIFLMHLTCETSKLLQIATYLVNISKFRPSSVFITPAIFYYFARNGIVKIRKIKEI